MLRSAETGKDHLYHATEDVSLRELTEADPYYYAPARYFRVTQHFMDAIGRETNTTVRTSRYEGTATVPGFTSPAYPCLTDTTVYPDGTSDYRVRTDRRGVRTISWSTSFPDREENVSRTFHPTNLTAHILLASNVTWRNGRSASLQSLDGGWSRETSQSEYTGDGRRRGVSIAEASDLPGALTNSLTHYDFLGRAIATLTPGAGGTWLVTSNSYAGASSRQIRSETTGRPATTYLYDELRENIGTIQSGVTSTSDTRYETLSNEIWRVTVQSTSANAVTNDVTTTREQMTGLSAALRSRTVGIAPGGSVTTSEASFNAAAKTLTTTVWTDGGTPTIRMTKFGALVEACSLSQRTVRYHDAFLTPYHVRTFHPVTGALLSRRFLGLDEATWDPVYTETWHGTLKVTGEAQFDAWGRETVRTDAMGHAVTNVYDVLGRLVANSGAAYPVDYAYDTQGRLTGLVTRYGASDAEAETGWAYDPATGLATNKMYADNSAVGYTHTPDGKPLRTTWARGAWREHAYDEAGLLATTTYGGTTPAVWLAYDAFQRLAAASNAVTAYAYANDALGAVTNEAAIIGTSAHALVREYDGFHRLASLTVSGQSVHYGYDAESRLAAVSNDAFAVNYAYTDDAWDAGYTITLTNGMILSRAAKLDPYRRQLVTGVSNAVAGSVASDYHYNYDMLGRVASRNNDAFGYNPRSEVTSSIIQPSHTNRYEYDGIGNALWASLNAATNTYTANSLNQYTNIANGSTVEPAYDLDGNLTCDDRFGYAWDAENRLTAVYSNSLCIVSNAYDHMSRRVLKVTPTATHTFVYDGWNLVSEVLIPVSGAPSTNYYVWGKDLSGALQEAGGVGGLLAVFLHATWHFPLYDNNGNVTAYLSEHGSIAAQYSYDAFGRTLVATGPLADAFRHRFSTKYVDSETGLYYYGYRFYSPELMRWLSRDPIEELGGVNLYGFVGNNPAHRYDILGQKWKIKREGKAYAIAVATSSSDSFDKLAQELKLDTKDYSAWAHTTDSEPKVCKEYRIPNTIYYHIGPSKYPGFWKILDSELIHSWKRRYKRYMSEERHAGFLVSFIEDVTQIEVVLALSDDYLYQYQFTGHGISGGVLRTANNTVVAPNRYTKYGINSLQLMACFTLDANRAFVNSPDLGRYNAWEWNVASRGTVVGYFGNANIFNDALAWRIARGSNRKGAIDEN